MMPGDFPFRAGEVVLGRGLWHPIHFISAALTVQNWRLSACCRKNNLPFFFRTVKIYKVSVEEKMGISVKLEVFEGPLDLLLHLLEKNKVNIYDIPIVEITNQYMEYMREMQRRDLNIMSEFLVMAATLLDIKSRMLLPKRASDEEEEPEDPRAELVQQLLEYKMFKCISYELKDRQMDAGRTMFKKPTIPDEVAAYEEPVDLAELIGDMTLKKLNAIFQSVMAKQENKIDPIRSKFGKIEKEEISLNDKMEYLEAYAAEHKRFGFESLLEKQGSKMEVIVTFLAILELMKTGKITIYQEKTFDTILIESKVAA